ncbi:retrovirus-related pol polyprotein from transposon TNT 1-94 [Tanacetum coccineum]
MLVLLTLEPTINRFQNSNSFLGEVIQMCFWFVSTRVCSMHMTGKLKLLIILSGCFWESVVFGNDHVAAILGSVILLMGKYFDTPGFFSLSLGHKSILGWARNVQQPLPTINLHEMASASPYLPHGSSFPTMYGFGIKFIHLNFDTINDLAKNDLVTGLPKFQIYKRSIVLLSPMRIVSIMESDLGFGDCATFTSRYTWSPVIIIRTDNGTEFKNQILKEYFDSVGISHQASSVRTPQQNGVVERRNRTLLHSKPTPSLHRSINKTPYELINGRKPDISFLHVFGALCYPKNDREDIGKLGAKGDIGFFIGYSADSCAYRVYNRRTKKIMETMNVTFDGALALAFEQSSSSKPGFDA